MVSSEVSPFPYNATKNDDKIYFSNQLCYKISLIWVKVGKTDQFLGNQKTGQLIYIVKGNLIYWIKSESGKIRCAVTIGLIALFGVSSPVKGIEMPLLPTPTPIIHLQKSLAQKIQIAPAVCQRLDKIRYDAVTVKQMLPLMDLNVKYVYINEKILKSIRAGDLGDLYYGMFVMTLLVFIFSSMDFTDAFTLLRQLGQTVLIQRSFKLSF